MRTYPVSETKLDAVRGALRQMGAATVPQIRTALAWRFPLETVRQAALRLVERGEATRGGKNPILYRIQ